MPAGVTPIEVAAECGRATAHDRPEDRALLHAQPRMLLDEGVTLRVEDIGHLPQAGSCRTWLPLQA